MAKARKDCSGLTGVGGVAKFHRAQAIATDRKENRRQEKEKGMAPGTQGKRNRNRRHEKKTGTYFFKMLIGDERTPMEHGVLRAIRGPGSWVVLWDFNGGGSKTKGFHLSAGAGYEGRKTQETKGPARVGDLSKDRTKKDWTLM